MFNAHRDVYQSTSTRYEDGLRIHRPAHHPRLQEECQWNGSSFQTAYPDATTVMSKQSPQHDTYPNLPSSGPTPLHAIDPRIAMDVRTVGLALESPAPSPRMDLSRYDYDLQVSEANNDPPISNSLLFSTDLPWQGPSPATEIGNSSYGYESQRSEASNTSFYNDMPQEYGAEAFQDVNPESAYGASDFPQLSVDGFSRLDIDDISPSAGPSQYPRSLSTSSTYFLPLSDHGFSGLDINDGVASSASPSDYALSLATSSRAPVLPYINPLHYTNNNVGSGHSEQLSVDQTQDSPMPGWNTANHFSDLVGLEDMKQPLYLWNGENCIRQQMPKKRQSVDIGGPFDFFRQGEIALNNRFDLHTEAKCSASSGMVTTRNNTEWDTTSQSEWPGAVGGGQETEMKKGELREGAPSMSLWSLPLDNTVCAQPPSGSVRRWKPPTVGHPHESLEYLPGSSRHQGFKILEPCDPSVRTERQRLFAEIQKSKKQRAR